MVSMNKADKLMALLLVVLGLAMFWGGYVMDRLEVRSIHPASIPGLVPMGLGILITICGGLLFANSTSDDTQEMIDFGKIDMLIWTGALCLAFSVLLVGHVPFYLATFLFITAFSARFTWKQNATNAERGRQLFKAFLMGAVFSALISALFRYAFLVRLP
ncbi:MAG: tripartite tricarboxylate transporter TctB family protein [Paracoccaceae bacterium]